MGMSLAISLEQVKSFISSAMFKTRFERLLQHLKTDDLSLEDITQEVESVRKARYENTALNGVIRNDIRTTAFL